MQLFIEILVKLVASFTTAYIVFVNSVIQLWF